jgi:hypothetical protein
MHDDDLRHLLGTVDRAVEPERIFSETLFERLSSEAGGGQPRSRVLVLLAATLLLAAAVGLGAAVAGGLVHLPWVAVLHTPGPSPAAASSSPSASPTGAPQVVEAPVGVLPAYATVSVERGPVAIRMAPDATSALVANVASGARLTIGFPSPLIVDGTLWYAVSADDPTSAGYAALDPTDGSVTVDRVQCAAKPAGDAITLDDLAGPTSGWTDLACYGNTEITVEGVEITSGLGGASPGTWTPGWLAYPFGSLVLVPEGNPTATVQIHLQPSVVLPSPDPSLPLGTVPLIRVSGHFDDPASGGCSVIDVPLGEAFAGGPSANVDPASAAIYCREQFVATSLTVIGTGRDPLMP